MNIPLITRETYQAAVKEIGKIINEKGPDAAGEICFEELKKKQPYLAEQLDRIVVLSPSTALPHLQIGDVITIQGILVGVIVLLYKSIEKQEV